MGDRVPSEAPLPPDEDLLPHEAPDRPRAASLDRRAPLLVWSLWHPTGESPVRPGGSWTGSLAVLRWSRFAWIVSLNLAVLIWIVYRMKPAGYLPALAFGFGLLAALTGALDALALPLARIERVYAAEKLAEAVGRRIGRSVAHLPLVALIHDERPEWPPGSFADAFAFLECRPEALAMHRLGESWVLPREAIECVTPTRYMGARGHGLVLADLAAPTLKYRAESGAAKSLALEWLSDITPEEIAKDSDVLRQRLESWMMGDVEAVDVPPELGEG